MSWLSLLASLFWVIGAFFFLAGTIGVIRFPDLYSRLHALTKCDNLGLGFIVIGLCCVADSPGQIAQLLLIWSLVLVASASSSYLIAKTAWKEEQSSITTSTTLS